MSRCWPSPPTSHPAKSAAAIFRKPILRSCSASAAITANWSPRRADPQVLAVAMRKAVINRGVSVVVLPGDVALKAAPESASSHWYHAPLPTVTPAEEEAAQAGAAYSLLQQYRAHVRQRLRRRPPRNWWSSQPKLKPHRPRPARGKGTWVRQPVRCGHDRADWLLFWLPHHDERRYPDPAGHPVPLSRLLPNRRENYPDRHQPRQHRRAQ